MPDILRLIDNTLAEGFADEEFSDLISAIQEENRVLMERRAQTFVAFSGRPQVLLGSEPAWDLGNRKYAVMTSSGAHREITFSPMSLKPKRF